MVTKKKNKNSNPEPVTRFAYLSRPTIFVLALTLTGSLIVVAVSWYALRVLPPQFPLYYSRADGVEQLAAYKDLYQLAGITLGLIIINGGLSYFLSRRYTILSRIIISASCLLVIFYSLALINVIVRIV